MIWGCPKSTVECCTTPIYMGVVQPDCLYAMTIFCGNRPHPPTPAPGRGRGFFLQFFAHNVGKKLRFSCSRPIEGACRGGGEIVHKVKTGRGLCNTQSPIGAVGVVQKASFWTTPLEISPSLSPVTQFENTYLRLGEGRDEGNHRQIQQKLHLLEEKTSNVKFGKNHVCCCLDLYQIIRI